MKQVNMNDDIKCNKNNTERKVSKNVWKTKMCYWTPDSVEKYGIELSDFQKEHPPSLNFGRFLMINHLDIF